MNNRTHCRRCHCEIPATVVCCSRCREAVFREFKLRDGQSVRIPAGAADRPVRRFGIVGDAVREVERG